MVFLHLPSNVVLSMVSCCLPFFPTCQVRVVRFYKNCPPSPPSPSPLRRPLLCRHLRQLYVARSQLQAADRSARAECAAPDLTQGAPGRSVQRRTSPARKKSQKNVRRYVRKYVRNGCQKMMSEDMSKEMSCQKRMSEDMPEKDVRKYVRQECQKICQTECQKKCQKKCQ